MKRTSSALAAAFALIFAASAALAGRRTEEGTWTAGGMLDLDLDSAMGSDLYTKFTLGHYFREGLMAGGYAAIADNDWTTTLEGGATMKWHFFDDAQSPFSLFLGADLGVANSQAVEDSATALVLGARIGLDFFLTGNAAVETAFAAHVATGDIYSAPEGLTNVDATLKLGLVFFF